MIQSILAHGQSHLVLSTAVGSVSHYYYSAALLSSTQTPFWYFDPTTYHSTSQAQNAGTLYHVNAAVICRSVSLIGKDVLPMKLVGVVLNVVVVLSDEDEEEGDNDDVDGRAN